MIDKMDKQVSNELKVLALEMINNAGSGHSGSVLSCGDALYTLYTKHLLSDGSKNINRDRFVLSNGHVCASLYSIFAGLNYFDFNEIKSFRKYGALLEGHPEIEVPGVDCNTGPLGQGIANAVGMAMAETILNKQFGVDHYTYCMTGDGCMEEGVGLEALSLAGLYELNKFILLYDKNNITLDGKLEISSVDNIDLKFKSMNFNVITCDGHNIAQIDKAITKAKKSKTKPTVIILNTIIGKDTTLANSNLSHGAVFDDAELNNLKKKLNITNEKLNLNNDTKNYLINKKQEIIAKFNEKNAKFNENLKNNKELLKKFNKFINNDFINKIKLNKNKISTREANNDVLNQLAKTHENIIVLSADLSSSTKVKINDGGAYTSKNRLGKNIAVGVREHAMGAVANGIALHGGLVPITSTFLAFSNYMIQPIRMAAIMKLPVMFTFSHSSCHDVADGVTHVPVEQLDQLRLIPNVTVTRPSDMAECVASYDLFFKGNCPMCMCVSKSSSNFITDKVEADKGIYFVTNEKSDINIVASGTEVDFALSVKKELKDMGIIANVLSAISLEVFEKQANSYKSKILNKPIFIIEASTCVKYLQYTSVDRVFGISKFGVSGNSESLRSHFGYDANKIAKAIAKNIK